MNRYFLTYLTMRNILAKMLIEKWVNLSLILLALLEKMIRIGVI